MNEKIKLLAEQAGVVFWEMSGDVDWRQTDRETLEKFAELIIRECTKVLFDESERLYAYSSECDIMRDSDEAELCAEKCMDNIEMIEKHFGVK